MSYIETNPLLRKCSNEDLEPLVKYITNANTNWLEIEEVYKKHQPNHKKYADEIFHHIRRFGGNTFRNIFRDGGPDYLEIVRDVAKKLGIKNPKDYEILTLETMIIEKILRESIEKAPEKDRKKIEAALAEAGLGKKDLSILLSGGSLAAVIGANMAGFAFYQVSLIVANTVAKQVTGQGLKLATNASLAKGLSILTGPVGWTLTGLWAAYDIAGPAFRVTVPCVIHIAMLRQKHMYGATSNDITALTT